MEGGSKYILSFSSFIHSLIHSPYPLDSPKTIVGARLRSSRTRKKKNDLHRWGDVAETEILDESIGVPCPIGWMRLILEDIF